MTKDDPHTTSLRCYQDHQRYIVDEDSEPDHLREKRYAGNVNVKNAEKTLDFKYIVPAQPDSESCHVGINSSSLSLIL